MYLDLMISLYCGGLMARKEAEGWSVDAEKNCRVSEIGEDVP
jgi:hypothetical protein